MAKLPYVGAILITIALAYGTWIGAVLGFLGAIGLLGSVYSRRDGLILFGPFAAWELVRTARKKQLFVFRTLLASAALGYLLLNFTRTFGRNSRGLLVQNEMSQRAEEVFIFVGITICGFSLLYSLITFPSILVEERETKRMDHLLVTDLRNSEIILGKIAGRVAVLFGYILTLLPILVLLSFLGGVDLNRLIVGSLILLLCLAGLTGICIASSAKANSIGAAARTTIIILFALLASQMYAKLTLAGVLPLQIESPWLKQCLEFLTHLNPIRVISEIENNTTDNFFDEKVLRALRLFATHQWILLALGWTIGTWSLRKPAYRAKAKVMAKVVPQSVLQSEEPTAVYHAGSYRPPLTDQPVLWNEMHTSNSPVGRFLTRLFKARYWPVPVLTLLAIGMMSLLTYFKDIFTSILIMSGHISFWMLAFPVGIMASRLIARERQLDTLNALLLTELETEEIIRQKWWAAVLSVRANYLIWVTVWTTGVLLGYMHPLAYILVNLIAIANIALAASLGLFSSIHNKTPAAATGKLVGLSFLYSFVILAVVSVARLRGSAEVLYAVFLSPIPIAPQSAATLLDMPKSSRQDYVTFVFLSILGLLVSGLMAYTIRVLVEKQFREQVRPHPTSQPQEEKAVATAVDPG